MATSGSVTVTLTPFLRRTDLLAFLMATSRGRDNMRGTPGKKGFVYPSESNHCPCTELPRNLPRLISAVSLSEAVAGAKEGISPRGCRFLRRRDLKGMMVLTLSFLFHRVQTVPVGAQPVASGERSLSACPDIGVW